LVLTFLPPPSFLLLSMKYKAIIFDLDGTIIDSMGIWRQVDMDFLGSRNIGVPTDLFDSMPQGNSYNQTAKYFKDRFLLPESIEEIMDEWTAAVKWHYEHDVLLKDGVRDTIIMLRNLNFPLAIGTSNHDDLASLALSQHDLHQYFEIIVTGTHDMLGKPFPDIFLKAARELSVEPETCIVIEDTLNGIRAARAAGMYAIAIRDEDSAPQWEQMVSEANFHADDYFTIQNHLKELLS
jgi:HAD superfamily hydrolase (TIGR01509 family)